MTLPRLARQHAEYVLRRKTLPPPATPSEYSPRSTPQPDPLPVPRAPCLTALPVSLRSSPKRASSPHAFRAPAGGFMIMKSF
jgi:hypothetical protein